MKKYLVIIVIVLLFPISSYANIVCRDGSISPSCTTCHKGCCSKHGGCTNNTSTKKKTTKKQTTTKKKTTTVKGCTDKNALNYNSKANKNDGSCKYEVLGCMDKNAVNYNSKATKDDGNCEYKKGCTDKNAINYDEKAITDDGSCSYESLEENDMNFENNAISHDNDTDNSYYYKEPNKDSNISVKDNKSSSSQDDESFNPVALYLMVGGTVGGGYAVYDKMKKKKK